MEQGKSKHFVRLPLSSFSEQAEAEPQVPCTAEEIDMVLRDLTIAVNKENYIPATPTKENLALSEDYVFDTEDEKLILRELDLEHFVGKIKDVGKGARNRRKRGLPQEYLYVFQYSCRLCKRDAQESGILTEDILVYIKINNRKTPYEQVFVISFHKNKPRNNK